MRCSDRLLELGVRVMEVEPRTGGEFVCTASEDVDVGTVLESLGFWDYTSPLSLFTLRDPWWSAAINAESEWVFLVMGDPHQEV